MTFGPAFSGPAFSTPDIWSFILNPAFSVLSSFFLVLHFLVLHIQSTPQISMSRTHGVTVDALDVLCAQLTRDLFAIAKFLVICSNSMTKQKTVEQHKQWAI